MKRNVIIAIAIIAVCFLLFVGFVTLVCLISLPVARVEKVAVINLDGPIGEDGQSSPFVQPGITPRYVHKQLERARKDPQVKAIVLKVNSPGGAVGASQEIAGEIKRTKKPIVVCMGDMAASGGYYISAPADKIVAKPGTLTGSIGVISQVADLTGLYEKLGIKLQTIKSGKHKDMYQRQLTAEEQQIMQGMCDELYDQFIKEVARDRKSPETKVRKLATGQLYTGVEAKKLGLIDELGDYQDAVDLAAKLGKVKKPVVEEYPPRTIWETLFGLGSQLQRVIFAKTFGRDYLLLRDLQNAFLLPRYGAY